MSAPTSQLAQALVRLAERAMSDIPCLLTSEQASHLWGYIVDLEAKEQELAELLDSLKPTPVSDAETSAEVELNEALNDAYKAEGQAILDREHEVSAITRYAGTLEDQL